MVRRVLIALLILFLLASIPILFYFWARSNGKPTPIPALNRLLPQELRLREFDDPSSLEVTNLQEPLNGTDCFLYGESTCLMSAVSTESGKLFIDDLSLNPPNTRLSIGLLLADRGGIFRHYQTSLARRTEPQPVYNALITMLSESSQQGINPSFLWAYYDYLYSRTTELNVDLATIGLDTTRNELLPDINDVSRALSTSLQLFPNDEGGFGQVEIAEDDLSRKLNTTPISQGGKAILYATAQLVGPDVTEQIFDQPRDFANYYTTIFRQPDLPGNYELTFSSSAVEAQTFYAETTPEYDFVVCHSNRPYACRAQDALDTDNPSQPRPTSCDPVDFLEYFCLRDHLPVVK